MQLPVCHLRGCPELPQPSPLPPPPHAHVPLHHMGMWALTPAALPPKPCDPPTERLLPAAVQE